MLSTKPLPAIVGALFAAGLACGQDAPLTFDGEWAVTHSCEGATGPYAERCAQGMRDVFHLSLLQQGRHVCGYHLATGHLGNRIDEGDLAGPGPSVMGTATGNVVTLTFKSARTGELGQATLIKDGDTIVWHVTQPLREDNWFPDDAVLKKQSAAPGHPAMSCEAAPHP
ncbi:hypothetical protein ACYT84_01085 [Ralstonia solanacearum]|uniref:hypothetical protein n=1 Tax=Ralstonia solanacearum TaxID=305 RepID=UPI0018D17A09|nr:hypothetical protein [Ralstonia solanacearum]